MPKAENLIGTTFAFWTIIGGPTKIGKHFSYLCQCTCGNQGYVRLFRLRNRKSLGCKPCSAKRRQQARADIFYSKPAITKSRWSSIVQGAKKRNLEITITRESAFALLAEQGFRCAITGWPIELGTKTKLGRKTGTASLDRINSSLGYVPGNIQWLHWTINKMKGAMLESEFFEACVAISESVIPSVVWPYVAEEDKEAAIRAFMKANAPKNLAPDATWQPLEGVEFYRESKGQYRR